MISPARLVPTAFLLLVMLLATCPRLGRAQEGAAVSAAPLIRFAAYRLPNGLRVVLAADRAAPVVALCVGYRVGSADELPGQAGLAHLCEHLMFQGSAHVGRGEHDTLIEEVGGFNNAQTSTDDTEFFEVVPANQLELLLFLESDRMRGVSFGQTSLDTQRAVVEAEKREKYDDQYDSDVSRTQLRLAYADFGYGHPIIGFDGDLDGVTLPEARSFLHTYYVPNNAVLALVGDFDMAATRAKIARYFADIPRRRTPPPPDAGRPDPGGERESSLRDDYNSLPLCQISYRITPAAHRDFPALAVLANILGSGRTSRLGQALVEPERALRVSAAVTRRRAPGLFVLTATLPAHADFAPAETTMENTVRRVQVQGVTAAELEKARNWLRVEALSSQTTALRRARALVSASCVEGDPQAVNSNPARLETVTAADVRRVARRYLRSADRVVITELPASDVRVELPPPGD